jgi:hypothetical protein
MDWIDAEDRTSGPSAPLRFAQDGSQLVRMSAASTGKEWGVLRGVQVAALEGHVSRSAVYLIHIEVRTGAGLGD